MKKKIWKKIHRGDPYLKKPTLGDQRKKSEKKIFEKKNFNEKKIFLNIKNEYLDVFWAKWTPCTGP